MNIPQPLSMFDSLLGSAQWVCICTRLCVCMYVCVCVCVRCWACLYACSAILRAPLTGSSRFQSRAEPSLSIRPKADHFHPRRRCLRVARARRYGRRPKNLSEHTHRPCRVLGVRAASKCCGPEHCDLAFAFRTQNIREPIWMQMWRGHICTTSLRPL